MTVRTTVRAALEEALALVLPVACAGCGAVDVALCEECRSAVGAGGVLTQPAVSGLPVWSGARFDGPTARIVRSLKEEGRTGLARVLAPVLRQAFAAAAGNAAGVMLVPVPTSRASFRRRGFHVAELVARRAGLPFERRLRLVRQPADQRGLGVDERRRNVGGSLVARSSGARSVLILDDVVTTGATLEEAARALRAAGVDVIGAVTIAATPRRLIPGNP